MTRAGICAVLLLLALPASAQRSDLEAAGEALRGAEAAFGAATDAEDRRVALSQAIAAYQEGRLALRRAMAATAAEQRKRARVLRAETVDLAAVLAALQRISQRSEPLLALGAGAPEDIVVAGILLDRARADATERVRILRTGLTELAALRGESAAMAERMQMATKALEDAASALKSESDEAGSVLPSLGQDVANLAALAAALDGVPEPLAESGAPPSRLGVPLEGGILRGYNERDEDGISRPGLSVYAPSGHLVRTPLAATVRYSGTLDSYGTVVIVEPDPGVLFVLAGLGDVLVAAGEDVLAGTGLGFLPGVHEEFLNGNAERDGDLSPQTLYIEVRVNGTPVNPADWFAYENEE